MWRAADTSPEAHRPHRGVSRDVTDRAIAACRRDKRCSPTSGRVRGAPTARRIDRRVRSKDELLDLVVDGVAGGVALPPGEGDWRERAQALAHSLRTALLAHPEGARLISERPIQSPNAFRIFDAGLGIFRDAGFPDEQAADAYFAFGNYVMGSVAQDTTGIQRGQKSGPGEAPTDSPWPAYVQQLPPDQFPNISALANEIYGLGEPAPEPDPGSRVDASSRRFDFGLDSLLDGFAARLDR